MHSDQIFREINVTPAQPISPDWAVDAQVQFPPDLSGVHTGAMRYFAQQQRQIFLNQLRRATDRRVVVENYIRNFTDGIGNMFAGQRASGPLVELMRNAILEEMEWVSNFVRVILNPHCIRYEDGQMRVDLMFSTSPLTLYEYKKYLKTKMRAGDFAIQETDGLIVIHAKRKTRKQIYEYAERIVTPAGVQLKIKFGSAAQIAALNKTLPKIHEPIWQPPF